ncbi:hypothetical protein CEXT_614341 [Caerostris extrusa]|uniref:Uncharacterized protein n=1 Tax=Caerostris extrusa TaxID=172846 RepID=A0AAV4MER9_CAEEX|nr:hypothetical protein CEXT_614341 [Caerostris extrusa]
MLEINPIQFLMYQAEFVMILRTLFRMICILFRLQLVAIYQWYGKEGREDGIPPSSLQINKATGMTVTEHPSNPKVSDNIQQEGIKKKKKRGGGLFLLHLQQAQVQRASGSKKRSLIGGKRGEIARATAVSFNCRRVGKRRMDLSPVLRGGVMVKPQRYASAAEMVLEEGKMLYVVKIK